MAEDKGLLIRVRNVPELVAREGAVATIAQRFAPGTIEDKALATIRDQLASSLKDKGVKADVTVVNPENWKASSSHLWRNVAIGLGVGLTGFVTWKLVRRKK